MLLYSMETVIDQLFIAHFAMLFQWACSGIPDSGSCFPDNRFLVSCHLLGTLSPNYLGSLNKSSVN